MRIHAAALVASLLAPALAHADGNASLGTTIDESGPGYGLVTVGVGLSGRRESGALTAVPSGDLVLTELPSGATIRHAYLYWAIYGNEMDTTVTLNGTAVTGEVIGRDGNTCWAAQTAFDLSAQDNIVYRADVASLVTANGTYTIAGFPSAEPNRDTQGATLLIVYADPAVTDAARVIVDDGASSLNVSGEQTLGEFDGLEPATVASAHFHVSVGDGQSALPEGTLRFAGTTITEHAGGDFQNTNGQFWDALTYDVTTLLDLTEPTVAWVQNTGGDCLLFTVAALAYRTTLDDDDDDGIDATVDNCLDVANPDQANADGDLVGDACDNCPNDSNAGADADEDGVGNACDSCRDVPNPDQANCDDDEFGDACDNCPAHANDDQSDDDDNGVGDECEGMVSMCPDMPDMPDAGPADASDVPDASIGDEDASLEDASSPRDAAPGRDAASGRDAGMDAGTGDTVSDDGGCDCNMGRRRSASWLASLLLLVLAVRSKRARG